MTGPSFTQNCQIFILLLFPDHDASHFYITNYSHKTKTAKFFFTHFINKETETPKEERTYSGTLA
jgi:hypothetical protein